MIEEHMIHVIHVSQGKGKQVVAAIGKFMLSKGVKLGTIEQANN